MRLYKVSPPRASMVFEPSTFWRSEDWESSTTRRREGYVEDVVLYAGTFEEVSIHLFPRVRTLRVRAVDADWQALSRLGLACSAGMTAYVFVEERYRAEVEAFRPTIFEFNAAGFTRVRRGEYVSRSAQVAVSSETLSMAQALERWNVGACYVDCLDDVTRVLSAAGVYFEVQT
jgi:hypothetical protein